MPARAAHRPPGEDDLRARGVVLRPRPPPPRADALRARRHARRQARRRARADPARRRRLRVQLDRRLLERRLLRVGPYDVPNARIDAYVVYTDNPPCGAMRGFGAVQTCFAHEAQMDKLAAALEHGPGRAAPPQRDEPPARDADRPAVAAPRRSPSCSSACARCPLPEATTSGGVPGGVANVTRGEGVVRGVGYAVGFKNVGYSEGFDDYSTARVRLSLVGRAARRGPHRGRRGRPGPRHRAGADRAHRARRRAGARAAGRHAGRLGRLDLGLAPDVR